MSFADADGAPPGQIALDSVLRDLSVTTLSGQHNSVVQWSATGVDAYNGGPIVLACSPRTRFGALGNESTAGSVAGSPAKNLADINVPFAAVAPGPAADSWIAVTDALGFRQMYVGCTAGVAAVSTSAVVLAAAQDSPGLDLDSVGVQSLLGWQLGDRTLFQGVTKIPPSTTTTLAGGDATFQPGADPTPQRTWPLDQAVERASQVLRECLTNYLEDTPDAVLQLTGGIDSRILLAAIPPRGRRRLRVMTLDVPGSDDTEIAASLARRYELDHQLASIDGLADLSPSHVFARVLEAAYRVDCMADPLGYATNRYAEEQMPPAPRIAGLGGEVARGFYYFGSTRARPVTARRVAWLARWRLFPNEAAPASALDPQFVASSASHTLELLRSRLTELSPKWSRATDEFYLWERMQRWAGLLGSSECLERAVVNPMLDSEFLTIVRSLPAHAKKNSLFLSRLLIALDPELASIPLDGRPAPVVYAQRGPRHFYEMRMLMAKKVTGKVAQRVGPQRRRPPVGAAVLAPKLAEYFRENPATLEPAAGLGIFAEPWLDGLASGTVDSDPSALALLMNVLGAQRAFTPSRK